jgi:hypothetical protein
MTRFITDRHVNSIPRNPSMVYGPIAALLVELFPARIRYSAMSLPYS